MVSAQNPETWSIPGLGVRLPLCTLAAFTTDPGHMFPVFTDRLAAFATRLSCLLATEFVGSAGLMCRATSRTGNFSLALGVHSGKTATPSLFFFYEGHMLNG